MLHGGFSTQEQLKHSEQPSGGERVPVWEAPSPQPRVLTWLQNAG